MLTIEMLIQNPALSDLTDSQRAAIAEMSRNDESTVINTRIGELHGQYDNDVLSVTGIAKNGGEKSYDYVKRVLNNYKTKIDGHKAVKAELESAKATVAELQDKLEKNTADTAIAQQLKDAKAQVTQLQAQLQAKEAEYTKKVSSLEADAKNIHVDYAFQAAVSGLKFKEGITENIQRVLLESARTEVLAKGTPDFITDNTGRQTLVLRDATGNILNNPKNNLNPYTFKELILETSLKDVLAEERKQTGGGTQPVQGGNSGGSLDLSAAKTQIEADKLITAHLLSNGLTRDSSAFAEQSMQLRAENEIAKLPIR